VSADWEKIGFFFSLIVEDFLLSSRSRLLAGKCRNAQHEECFFKSYTISVFVKTEKHVF
jgi:hypothetical protein